MSLSANYKPVKLLGNGVTKNFTFGFNMINSAYCRVFYQNTTTGEKTDKVIEKDYSLIFDDNGGTITVNNPPSADEYIVIYRVTAQTQESDFLVGESFPAQRIEDAFDKDMAAIQELQDASNRTPKIPEGYDISLTLPIPNAGKGLIWNPEENGFVNSEINIDELEQTTKGYREQAEAARDAAQEAQRNANADAENAAESAGLAANYAEQAHNTAQAFDEHAAVKTQEFDANAAEKQFAVDASAAAAKVSENNANIWAEGTDEQVQALGGTHSSKGWAEANENLNYTDITNCITKIPQDIKLELVDGVLTLKAGSKVYVPNGVGVFDELVFQEDKEALLGNNNNGQYFVFARGNGTEIFGNQLVSEAVSGTTPPAYKGLFYNTEENKIYFYDNGTVADEGFSLPLAIVTASADEVVSIDQVFNGFGYIGSTIFALPGVEGLIPNGRNTDGSLNNIKFTTTSVLTMTETRAFSGNIGLNASTIQNFTTAYYDDKSNLVLNRSGYNLASALCGTLTRGDSGRITSFSPKNTFQAVDRNEYYSLQGIANNIDYIIEQGSNFVKFKSGKLICYGVTSSLSGTNATMIPLPKPYANSSYSVLLTTKSGGTINYYDIAVTSSSTVSFDLRASAHEAKTISWLTIGTGA